MKQVRLSVVAAGRERGFTLIEVLVAVLVLGVGLLGVAAMQAAALRNGQSALERSQAVVQTYAILDAMRANRADANNGRYNLTTWTCTAPAAGATLRENDLNRWITALKQNLGEGACGRINCGTTRCTIDVRWDDSRGLGGSDAYQVSTSTRL